MSKFLMIKNNEFYRILALGSLWVFIMMCVMAWIFIKQDHFMSKQQISAINTNMVALGLNNQQYFHCINNNQNIIYIAWCLENERVAEYRLPGVE